MKDAIVVLHSKDINKASRLNTNKPFAWLYLGQDVQQRENISQALGKESCYSIGDLLQRVAHKEKQPFLDSIAELGIHQKNKLYWWASNTAYKCPLTDDLFLLWCYAAVFNKVCSQERGGEEKSLLVLVEDRWLYRHLWKRYKDKDSSFSFLSRKSIAPELLKSIVKGIAIRGYFVLKAGQQIWHTKSIVRKNNGREIYLYSSIQDRFFQKDGEFEDAFWGRLPHLITSNGLSAVYLTPLFLSPDLKSKCLNYSKSEFIFLDQYITIWSIVRSLVSFFYISSFSFSSLRILLLREIACEFSSFSFVRNILLYFVFKKWLKEIDQGRINVIYPFENRPQEKMLCLATNELDKNIRLVAYQHYPIPSLLLNCFLGDRESTYIPAPDLIVTNGQYALNQLRNAGYGEVQFVDGGALRYEYLYKIRRDLTGHEKELKTILVALPYLNSLTEEMLLAIFNAFEVLADEKIRFAIKFHPAVPLESLKIQPPVRSSHFQTTDKSISELLNEVDLVLYSSTSVGLEALLSGVPVIRYYSEHILDLDPLDTFDERVIKTCSENSVKQVILAVLNEGIGHSTQESTSEIGKLDRFFSPVNEDVWRQIVGL